MENTRSEIIKKSAVIFNQQGYTGSSMSDVMKATGLGKGVIYWHFKNKEELAIESFEYAIGLLRNSYRSAAVDKKTAVEKIISVLSVYSDITEKPLVDGGCPLLNTSIDTDDTHPVLKQKVQSTMNEWLEFLRCIIEEGIESGEFRSDINVKEVTVFLTCAFEGSIMMGKLYDNSNYIKMYLSQLSRYINSCVNHNLLDHE